jgi:NAD(P)-dependent dehydrogenase (short-subunit alcohol dehydrogenase family)
MSGQDDTPRCSLTRTGRSRRRFLEGTALAAGTAALLPAGMAEASKKGDTPASCPEVKTPLKDVEGKVAFITGGDSGIGLGIARACAEAGMKLVITYRSQAHLDEALKLLADAADRVHAVNLDVTDREGFKKARDEALEKFQKVHMVVANAGVGTIDGGLSHATFDDYDFTMNVNATGVFNTIRTFLPVIQAQGEGGQVVATSSLAGLLGHGPAGVYTASKFAVVGMMEALRCELDAEPTNNVGVTVFCPGLVNTNIGDSNRNRPATMSDTGFKFDAKMMGEFQDRMKAMRGPPPGMDPLEAGRRLLTAVRNNDLYVLTTPEFEDEFRSRGEAIVASVPADIHAPEARVTLGRMILGKPVYAAERDRRRCRAATRKA